MGRLLIVVAAALGGLAFWRRKSLKDDAARVTDAAKTATARVTGGGRRQLVAELGEAVYNDRTDPDVDLTEEIDRLVIDLRELDQAAEEVAGLGADDVAGDESADAPVATS